MPPALQSLLDQLDESESDSIACILRLLGGDIGVQLALLAQGAAAASSISTFDIINPDADPAALPSMAAKEVSLLNLSGDTISIRRTGTLDFIMLPDQMSVSVRVAANANEIQIWGDAVGSGVQIIATT